MPDDHSESVPPLPIPNRTVKRFRANDSAATSVKVGNRQAPLLKRPQTIRWGRFAIAERDALRASLLAPNRPSSPAARRAARRTRR